MKRPGEPDQVVSVVQGHRGRHADRAADPVRFWWIAGGTAPSIESPAANAGCSVAGVASSSRVHSVISRRPAGVMR